MSKGLIDDKSTLVLKMAGYHQALGHCWPSYISPYGIRHWVNVVPVICHHMAADTEPMLTQLYVNIWHQALSQCCPSDISPYGSRHWANVDPAICQHMASGTEPMLSQLYHWGDTHRLHQRILRPKWRLAECVENSGGVFVILGIFVKNLSDALRC